MNYFQACKTIEDVKKLYKKLVFDLHPDVSGRNSQGEFIEMKRQFDIASKRLKNVHATKEGTIYEKENNEDFKEYANIIEKLVRMQNVIVEICGTWIWVSGDTKVYKDMLKEMGFKWGSMKKAWYFHSDQYIKKGNKKFTLDEIRETFGSRRFENEQSIAIN